MKPHPRAQTLAAAVAGRDLERLGSEFDDQIRLRALLPGGPIEVHGREAALAEFDRWFGSYRQVDLVEAAGEEVGDRLLVHYRLSFEPDEDPHVLTQTWVSTLRDGRLSRIDLLCSGFRKGDR